MIEMDVALFLRMGWVEYDCDNKKFGAYDHSADLT